jgi:Ca-activated chloride channel family protein
MNKRRIPMKQKSLALTVAVLMSMPLTLGGQAQPAQTPAPRAAGQGGGQPQQGQPLRIVANSVVVPVTVKGSQGQLVADLRKEDFRVFADNVEQKILQFTSDPFPLSAVILIDDDLPQKQAEQVQKSLATISAGFGPNDEAALVTYSEYPTTLVDFSSNNDDLYTHLKRLEIGSHSRAIATGPTSNPVPVINGNTMPNSAPPTGLGIPLHGSGRYQTDSALDDALYSAADMLKPRGDRRKIIFLISDGTNSRQNKHTFNDTVHELLTSNVSVYSISVSHTIPVPTSIGKSLAGERGLGELQKYAAGTGGDTFFAAKQPELERLYSDVTEEARNEYTLTFQPSGVQKDRDFHPIEVRVRRPGLNILTRQGYYESGIGQ